MKNTESNPTSQAEGLENNQDGFNRDDSNRSQSEGYRQFARDKRKRIKRVEKNPNPRESSSYQQGERRSYNPNFTSDNRPRFNNQREDRDFNRDEYFNSVDFNPDEHRQQRQNRPYGERSSYQGNNRQGQYQGNRPSGNSYNRDGGQNRFNKDNRGPGRDYNREGGDSRYNREGGDNRYNREEGQGRYNRDNNNRYNKDTRYGNDNRNRKPGPGGKPRPGQGKKGPSKPAYPQYTSENYPKFPSPRFEEPIRLNRYLALAGLASRREADEFIKAGNVTVNGETVTELGTKVLPTDLVRYNENIVRTEKKIYILMNKPKGYVTTLEDPHAEKTVMDLLKNACSERVYPVGRLDKNSMGVLLFTNDGDLTKKLTHPAHNKKKIYQVTLDKPLTRADMETLVSGIVLEDGEIKADAIDYVGASKKDIGIEIHSGRNRIVRRMFESLGYKVHKLDRVYFGGLTKKNLKRGAWRFLTPREVNALSTGMYE